MAATKIATNSVEKVYQILTFCRRRRRRRRQLCRNSVKLLPKRRPTFRTNHHHPEKGSPLPRPFKTNVLGDERHFNRKLQQYRPLHLSICHQRTVQKRKIS